MLSKISQKIEYQRIFQKQAREHLKDLQQNPAKFEPGDYYAIHLVNMGDELLGIINDLNNEKHILEEKINLLLELLLSGVKDDGSWPDSEEAFQKLMMDDVLPKIEVEAPIKMAAILVDKMFDYSLET